MEVSDVRKRLLQTIDRARRAAAEHRARADAAARFYEEFLEKVATPVFRMFGIALRAEGHLFVVHTPAGGLRLASERSAEDYIELALDTAIDPPAAIARVSRGRGHRVISTEREIREKTAIERLTEEDVLEFLLAEIVAFVVR
jgi:hypothetical protein